MSATNNKCTIAPNDKNNPTKVYRTFTPNVLITFSLIRTFKRKVSLMFFIGLYSVYNKHTFYSINSQYKIHLVNRINLLNF